METMRLVPINGPSKEVIAAGSFKLDKDAPVLIGRAPANTIKLDASAVLYSSKHCKLFFNQADGQWHIQDSSTNGTFIQQPQHTGWTRVPKNETRPVPLNSIIRLSTPNGATTEVIQFKLEPSEGSQTPDRENEKHVASPTTEKRKETTTTAFVAHSVGDGGGDNIGQPASKRPKAETPASRPPPSTAVATTNKMTAPSTVARAPPEQPTSPVVDGGAAAGGQLAQLVELTAANKKAREDLQTERDEVKRLNTSLRNAVREAEEVRSEKAALEEKHKQEVAALKSQLTGIEKKATASTALEKEVNSLNRQIDQLSSKIKDLDKSLATAKEAAEKALQDRDWFKKASEMVEGRNTKLEEQIKTLEEEKAAVVAQLETATANIDVLEVSKQTLTANVAAQQLQVRNLKEEVEGLVAEKQAMTAQVATATTDVASMRQQLATAVSELEDARAQISGLMLKDSSTKETQAVLLSCLDSIRAHAEKAKNANEARAEVYHTFMKVKEQEDAANEAMMAHIQQVAAQVAALDGTPASLPQSQYKGAASYTPNGRAAATASAQKQRQQTTPSGAGVGGAFMSTLNALNAATTAAAGGFPASTQPVEGGETTPQNVGGLSVAPTLPQQQQSMTRPEGVIRGGGGTGTSDMDNGAMNMALLDRSQAAPGADVDLVEEEDNEEQQQAGGIGGGIIGGGMNKGGDMANMETQATVMDDAEEDEEEEEEGDAEMEEAGADLNNNNNTVQQKHADDDYEVVEEDEEDKQPAPVKEYTPDGHVASASINHGGVSLPPPRASNVHAHNATAGGRGGNGNGGSTPSDVVIDKEEEDDDVVRIVGTDDDDDVVIVEEEEEEEEEDEEHNNVVVDDDDDAEANNNNNEEEEEEEGKPSSSDGGDNGGGVKGVRGGGNDVDGRWSYPPVHH